MINFSRVSDKSIVGKIFRLLVKLLPRNTILYILQGKLKGKKWIIGSYVHSCWLGSYAYKEQILFSKIIKQGSIVYDIGANVGFYTLLASVLVGPRGKVFAFEPAPRNIYYLKRHLRLNRCDNVMVIEAAVSDKDDIAFLEETIISSQDHLSTKGNLKVKTISLDNLVAKGKIPLPDYIKIDAEGAELLVLFGAKKILVNCNPTIFLSTHGFDLRSQCCTFLNSINYDLQSIDENEDINKAYELLAFKKR